MATPSLGAGVVHVACIGDSLTEGFRGVWSPPTENTYPKILQQLLGERFNVVNLGSSGATMCRAGKDAADSSMSAGWWSRTVFSKLVSQRWDLAIVMLGTNDCKSGRHDGPDNFHLVQGGEADDYGAWLRAQLGSTDKPTFAQDYAAFVALLRTLGTRSAGPQIFMCIPPPALVDGAYHLDATLINSVLPRLVPRLADAIGVPRSHVIDNFHALGGAELSCLPVGGATLELAQAGNGPSQWYVDENWGDQVHPCDRGLRRLAHNVMEALAAAGVARRGDGESEAACLLE